MDQNIKVYQQFGTHLRGMFDRLKTVDAPEFGIPLNVYTSVMNRGVGVEVECEDFEGDTEGLGLNWEVKKDNSLRAKDGTQGGSEFVTRYGVRLYHLKTSLPRLEKTVTRQEHSFSVRTSVHVHVDVRYLPAAKLENILTLYTVFEDAMFQYAGPARASNIFCVPLRNSPYIADPSGTTLNEMVRRWEKYCAMNMAPIREFGTIEFRHMEGNCDAERIYQWVMMLALLVYYASTHSTKEVQQRIREIKSSSQYTRFAEEVFYDLHHKLVINPHTTDHALSDAKQFFNIGAR